MTAEELLAEISNKLDTVLERLNSILESWSWLKSSLQRGALWIQTPAGEFGLFSRVTYGELLIAILFVVVVTLEIVKLVHRTVSARGWF